MNLFASLAFVFVVIGACQAEGRLPCTLIWREASAGSATPSGAVRASGTLEDETEQLVSGEQMRDGKFYSGRYDVDSLQAYFPYINENGTVTVLESFKLLTNPYKCTITWTDRADAAEFRVKVNVSSTTLLVARAMVDGEYYAGQVDTRTGTLSFGREEGEQVSITHENIQYLVSYSNGFRFEISDMVFDRDLFEGGQDFVGMDTITNDADTEVVYSVSHRKYIKEMTKYTLEETWTSTYTETVTVGFLFWKKKKTTTTTYTRTQSHTVITEEETDVTVAREIAVPPHTSLEVCTVIGMSNNFEVGYTALGKYSAPGMAPADVLRRLQADGIENARIQDEYVVVPIQSSLSGSLALSTKFVTAPVGSPDGCVAARKRIMETKAENVSAKLRSNYST